MSHQCIGRLMIFIPLFLSCLAGLWYAFYELFEREEYLLETKKGQDWRAHGLVAALFGWVTIAFYLLK